MSLHCHLNILLKHIKKDMLALGFNYNGSHYEAHMTALHVDWGRRVGLGSRALPGRGSYQWTAEVGLHTGRHKACR